MFFAAVPFGSASQASDEHGQASEDHGQASEDHGQAFTEITGLMKLFGERDNVSFMKVGRVAMSMGKTFGKAAYGECLESTKELIEDEIGKHLSPNNLAYSNKDGQDVIDEVFGTTSPDGETVSDLVIILHGQSVICIRGSLASTDVPRTVNRLKRQL